MRKDSLTLELQKKAQLRAIGKREPAIPSQRDPNVFTPIAQEYPNGDACWMTKTTRARCTKQASETPRWELPTSETKKQRTTKAGIFTTSHELITGTHSSCKVKFLIGYRHALLKKSGRNIIFNAEIPASFSKSQEESTQTIQGESSRRVLKIYNGNTIRVVLIVQKPMASQRGLFEDEEGAARTMVQSGLPCTTKWNEMRRRARKALVSNSTDS